MLESLLTRLPDHVILQNIIPFTYRLQSKELCEDIQSFHITINEIKRLYKVRHFFLGENEIWQEWLVNDIATFINKGIPSIYGYTENCLEKYRRLFILKNKPHWHVRQFVWNITTRNNLNVPIFINIGLLTTKERTNLMLIMNLLRDNND